MRLPWQKPVQAPVDVQAIKRQATADVLRVLYGSSPMMGATVAQTTGTHKIYAMGEPLQYAMPIAPYKRPGSQVSVKTLRLLADTYDVLRACIQHLKREVTAVPISVRAKDKTKADAAKGRIAEAELFFQTRGGLGGQYTTRDDFEGMMLEDLLVVGASSVYYVPNRGGGMYQCMAIDAATIRPVTDAWGWGEDRAYEQWVQGILVGSYTRDELSYSGLSVNARSYMPYYASPIEWLINAINSALRADEWNRNWLTDGNTPADMIALPETYSNDQVRQFAEYWDAMLGGETKERIKTKFVPGGSQPFASNSRKDQDFQEFELWLLRRTCAIMGCSPAAIGFAGEQYKVSQEGSMESASAFGAGTILQWRKHFYDDLLVRMGFDDLEVTNVIDREEQASERATRNAALIGAGIKTINEARTEEDLDPIPNGDVTLVLITLTPLETAIIPPPDPIELAKATKPPVMGAKPAGKPSTKRAEDLKLWEKKSLARLKSIGRGSCTFDSDSISLTDTEMIYTRLLDAVTAEQVRSLFAEVRLENETETL